MLRSIYPNVRLLNFTPDRSSGAGLLMWAINCTPPDWGGVFSRTVDSLPRVLDRIQMPFPK